MGDVNVVIVEDDARYREGLETLFHNAPGFTVAAALSTASAAVEAASPAWDLVFMDIDLSDRIDGIEATRRIKRAHPALPIVMITVFEEPATILQAICAGADGYLLKHSSAREILAQARTVLAGGAPMTAGVARSVLELVRRHAPAETGAAPARLDLTDRERDVLRALVAGHAYKGVAAELDISVDTVRSHIRQLYKKLQVHSAAEAVSRAIRDGLV